MQQKTHFSRLPETVSLMKEIAGNGIEMFCLSNMSRETYDHIRTQDFFEMFSGIVISGLENCMKPDEEIFHLTVNRFELEPNNTFFIDDSLPNIETARHLGIPGVSLQTDPKLLRSDSEIITEQIVTVPE